MFEIILVCGFALLTVFLVVDTQKKLKKHNKVCNIVLDSAKLKSDNFSMDDAIYSLKNSNAEIVYDCLD